MQCCTKSKSNGVLKGNSLDDFRGTTLNTALFPVTLYLSQIKINKPETDLARKMENLLTRQGPCKVKEGSR